MENTTITEELEKIIRENGMGDSLSEENSGHRVGDSSGRRRSSDILSNMEGPSGIASASRSPDESYQPIRSRVFKPGGIDLTPPAGRGAGGGGGIVPIPADALFADQMDTVTSKLHPPIPPSQVDATLLASIPLSTSANPPRWPWEMQVDDPSPADPSSLASNSLAPGAVATFPSLPGFSGAGAIPVDPITLDPFNLAHYMPTGDSAAGGASTPSNGSIIEGQLGGAGSSRHGTTRSSPSGNPSGSESLAFMDFAEMDPPMADLTAEMRSFMTGGYKPTFPLHCPWPRSGKLSEGRNAKRRCKRGCDGRACSGLHGTTQIPDDGMEGVEGQELLGRIDYFTEDTLPPTATAHL